ncbi:acyl-CoA dehydrogenase family protein [Sphingobium sp.]|uniref:acyl-CoA dehydrogenase family protein n=1 Tax=Sphingobium sp. TaxID=1912891 RepID=UPI0035C6A86A
MNDSTAAPRLAECQIPPGDDFLSAEELAQLTPERLIERTRALKPLLANHAREAERLRRPVDAVWAAIRKSGYFYLMVPRRFGGLELTPDEYIDATLPLAEGCASTGWVASFCAQHNWLLAQFPEETQAEIWGRHPYIVAPSVAAPPGKADPVEGGYRLTGHWKWGTGVMHADWVMVNAFVPGDAGPVMHMFILPAGDATVIDNWHVDGMIGTGSNDILLSDLFVASHRAFPVGPARSGRGHAARLHDNPLYASPMLPSLAVTAAIPALGAARSALGLTRERLAGHVKMGSEGTQAEKPAAQMRLARADMLVRSAELAIRDAARRNVGLGVIDEPEQTQERIQLRGQIAFAVGQCREAIQTLCESSGSSVHNLDNPLQRALRDIQVMASHVVYDLDVATELHGRALVGLAPNSTLT